MIITINSTFISIDDGRFIKGSSKKVSYDYDFSTKTIVFWEVNRLLASGLINTVVVNGIRLDETNYKEVLKDLFPTSSGGGGGGTIDTSNFLLKNDGGISQGDLRITSDKVKVDAAKIELHATSNGNISLHSEGNMTVLSTGNITQTSSATNTTIGNNIINTVPGQNLIFNSTGLTLNDNKVLDRSDIINTMTSNNIVHVPSMSLIYEMYSEFKQQIDELRQKVDALGG